MSTLRLAILFTALLPLGEKLLAASQESVRPNVVLIMTDDKG